MSFLDLVRRAPVQLVDLPIRRVEPAQVRLFRCSWGPGTLEADLLDATHAFLAGVNAGLDRLARDLRVSRPHPIRLAPDGTAYRGPYRRTFADEVLEASARSMMEAIDRAVLEVDPDGTTYRVPYLS